MPNPETAPWLSAAPGVAEDLDLAPSRLLLVRHGESTWNVVGRIQGQLDPPLSDRGREQALELAARLRGHRLAAFYCSDLTRARQTAAALAPAVGMEPVPLAGLREIGLGAWEGKTAEEVCREFPDDFQAWRRERSWDLIPGGEGACAFERRVAATLRQIEEQHPWGDVLCVTHGGVIQVALLAVIGRRSTGFFPFAIDNGSLSVIRRSDGRSMITAVNDTCHLS
jgi:broad specificity phosphatase PhoE